MTMDPIHDSENLINFLSMTLTYEFVNGLLLQINNVYCTVNYDDTFCKHSIKIFYAIRFEWMAIVCALHIAHRRFDSSWQHLTDENHYWLKLKLRKGLNHLHRNENKKIVFIFGINIHHNGTTFRPLINCDAGYFERVRLWFRTWNRFKATAIKDTVDRRPDSCLVQKKRSRSKQLQYHFAQCSKSLPHHQR